MLRIDAIAALICRLRDEGIPAVVDPAEREKYGLKVGDNVSTDIAVPCGECALCRSGDDANCIHMQVTNGGSIEKHRTSGAAMPR